MSIYILVERSAHRGDIIHGATYDKQVADAWYAEQEEFADRNARYICEPWEVSTTLSDIMRFRKEHRF